MYRRYSSFPPYISVAQRRDHAQAQLKGLLQKDLDVHPIQIESRTIANTFWGKAWCKNLENYSDYENRIPRGRSYLRHGSVLDLRISKGLITGMVAGSHVYDTLITIQKLKPENWERLVQSCIGEIGSVIDLLQGHLSDSVMKIMTQKTTGLFPNENEIAMQCTCPDGAYMCKHLAAMLYGVGARLDRAPELLFLLRQVEYADLITAASKMPGILEGKQSENTLEDSELSDVFGIDIS